MSEESKRVLECDPFRPEELIRLAPQLARQVEALEAEREYLHTDKLTPEQRKRVAEAVGFAGAWEPEKRPLQWKALVTWLAQHLLASEITDFRLAICSGNTDALERMAYEILEAYDDNPD